jgi:hypothetical protein
MPNWCHNKITLSHDDPAQIERVKAHKDNVLQEFIPCPQELLDGEGWYDWRVNNWGTKWDIALDITRESEDGKSLVAFFESAWSPPIEAYQKLEKMGFEIDAIYSEPGMSFAGRYKDSVDDYYASIDYDDPDWDKEMDAEVAEMLQPEYESYQMWNKEAQNKEPNVNEQLELGIGLGLPLKMPEK